MNMQHEHLYQAMVSHDDRFDGHFYIGVSSTGVYCRPICRVRTPKRENCTFYTTPAQAETAGFRPCLKCRPELSPQTLDNTFQKDTIISSIIQLEDQGEIDFSISALAKKLNITERHLRRITLEQLGTTPSNFILTRRLLRAKKLLTETPLSIAHIALISGFGSLRSFNTHFKSRYRLTPSALRKPPSTQNRAADNSPEITIQLLLQYRPPYDWLQLIDFLQHRSIQGVEHIEGQSYIRTVSLSVKGESYNGWLQIQPHKNKDNTLTVELSESLAAIIPILLRKLEHQFDLHAEPSLISNQLNFLARNNPGIRLPGSFDGFEMSVRAILGQQITVKAAHTLAKRFAQAFGKPIKTPLTSLTTLFPSPQRVAGLSIDQIASLGIISKRAQTIISLAQSICKDEISLQPTAHPEQTIAALEKLAGIGPWTAHYIAMRALHWPDAFPHTDLGVMKALKEKRPKQTLLLAEKWRPWRAYAVMHLWESLKQEK
ncbi:DNA-3-methyladenine glycosylase 2 family protein [Neptunomonas japonica]|uniref:DNA-3-methyladenine glycosylase II n=1 Tax=Neptunomonas japonica JAMM 1380 TaxID=1441457 RepID=A0A7R6P6N1_9GAMM|nr:Ada metal-binding domain-containing protein [Neptunomonas japonica]BBB28293.1 AraC family transcriptional regulator, regulatory protein of adaptative response/DNA-3-methyladenine glycosylase II [Neptunomonas japonica JAMM 1380]